MEEQSHKDEMRAALRGDFERMRRRQAQDESEPITPSPLVSNEASGVAAPEASGGSWLERLLRRDH